MTFPHSHTVAYDFDTSDITELDQMEIIKRHYDFIGWCENNARAPYLVDPMFSTSGITVKFEHEDDYLEFLDFCGNNNWIFLHN